MGKKYKVGDFIEVEELDDNTKNEDNNVISIDSTQFKGQELKYYQNNLQGKVVIHPVLGEIHLGKKGRRETGYRVDKKYLAIICFIDKIIATGYSDGQPEKMQHPRTDGIKNFYPIYNEILFDGRVLGVTVIIAEDNLGRKYYMYRTYTQNESTDGTQTGLPQIEELCPLHGADNIIINDKRKNVNLSIKDLNEVLQKYIEE